MATTIFVMTHKVFCPPEDPVYAPLQVGAALEEDLGYLRDDNGADQISELNGYFGPLTGVYWVWKNYPGQENIGICPEGKFFTEEDGRIRTEQAYEALLQEYDVIASGVIHTPMSYRDTYGQTQHPEDLDAVGASLAKLYPEDVWAWDAAMEETVCPGELMCVMRRAYFDDFCSWMFHILMDAGQTIDPSHYEKDQMQVYAVLAKELLQVWIRARGVRAYSDTMEDPEKDGQEENVLSMIRDLLLQHETEKAWEMCRQVAGDIGEGTLPVSDEGNDLLIAEQVLYLKQLDEKDGHDSLWSQEWDLFTLTDHYRNIYSMMQLVSTGEELGEYEVEYLRQSGFNAMTAEMMVNNDPAERLQKPPLKGDAIVTYLAKYNLF